MDADEPKLSLPVYGDDSSHQNNNKYDRIADHIKKQLDNSQDFNVSRSEAILRYRVNSNYFHEMARKDQIYKHLLQAEKDTMALALSFEISDKIKKARADGARMHYPLTVLYPQVDAYSYWIYYLPEHRMIKIRHGAISEVMDRVAEPVNYVVEWGDRDGYPVSVPVIFLPKSYGASVIKQKCIVTNSHFIDISLESTLLLDINYIELVPKDWITKNYFYEYKEAYVVLSDSDDHTLRNRHVSDLWATFGIGRPNNSRRRSVVDKESSDAQGLSAPNTSKGLDASEFRP